MRDDAPNEAGDTLFLLVTPLAFVGAGVWVLWQQLAESSSDMWFWASVCGALVVAAALVMYATDVEQPVTAATPRWLIPGVALAGLIVTLTRALPSAVLAALVAVGCGVIFGLWVAEVREAWTRRNRAVGKPPRT